MSKWNIGTIRKIAGLPLTEAWDDVGDDEDPDVKIAMSDKKQQEFEKKNKPALDAAKKEMADKAKAQKEAAAKKKAESKPAPAKPAEKKPVEAKKEQPAKAEPKKEEPKAAEKKEEPAKAEGNNEAKRRGAKPNENSKSQRAAAWIRSNPSAKRGEFLKWAKENLEMGAAYGSAFFARHNPKSSRQPATQKNECYVITHPHMPSFLLAENREMNMMQWIDPSSPMEPMIFSTLAEAEKTSKYMSEWKSQSSKIEHIVLED